MAAAYIEPDIAKEIYGDPRDVFTFGFTSHNPPSPGGTDERRLAGLGNMAFRQRRTALPRGSAVIAGYATRKENQFATRTDVSRSAP